MRNYKKLYLQKEETGSVMKETVEDFGMWVMADTPFKTGSEAKSLPSNDWIEDNGIEEYVPASGGLPLKAYDMKIGFGFKNENGTPSANAAIVAFRDYLTGRDSTYPGVWLKMYFEGYGIGRQKVRFSSMTDPEYWTSGNSERAFFEVTFKVDDPVTEMEIVNGNIVEA